MTDTMTDDSASAEPVTMPDSDADALPLSLDAQDDGEEVEVSDDDEAASPEEDDDDGLTDYTAPDGRTYRVPAEVKDGLMLKADHTRKTMALAEERRLSSPVTRGFKRPHSAKPSLPSISPIWVH